MSLEEDIELALRAVGNGEPPMQFEVVDNGRTLRMTNRETGDLEAQFTVVEPANFNDMSWDQALTVVFAQLGEGIVQGSSPENPAVFMSEIALPPKA